MVRPAKFGFNPETGVDNHYQDSSTQHQDYTMAATREFDGAVEELRKAGVTVKVFQDTETPNKPDAIFPNNWISCHQAGEVILYPMATPGRREERRQDVLAWLQDNFQVTRVVDMTKHEEEGRYLEGTGSIVFDHVARRAFACTSLRTHPDVLKEVCYIILMSAREPRFVGSWGTRRRCWRRWMEQAGQSTTPTCSSL